jgi:hypothetical protein
MDRHFGAGWGLLFAFNWRYLGLIIGTILLIPVSIANISMGTRIPSIDDLIGKATPTGTGHQKRNG